MATTTKFQPTNYEETDPVDHSLFGPITVSNDDDFLKDLTQEWDERRHQATMFFRRVSFSEKFGLFAMPTTDGQLSELTGTPDHIAFDDVFLATNALSPTPVEMGGSLILENNHSCMFTGELDGSRIMVQVLKKFRGNQDFFIHQIEMRKNCVIHGIANLLRYSCDTKHLILVYEYIDLGPLNTLIAPNHTLPKLNWAGRVQIVYDIASVINELHSKYQTAHLNINSQNIFLDRHYQCKLGDFGHCGDNLEFNYIEDIHGLGKVIAELYFDSTLADKMDGMVDKVRKWGSDLTAFLCKRHELLCDVDDNSLLSFLQLAQFCLQCDFTIESNEVYGRVSEFYEEQSRLSTVLV